MKSLVLAEKPSVARDIARVLKCGGGSGYMEGSRYVVTWALGHLVTLADPESYGDNYKTWKLEELPIIPGKMELEVIKQTSAQFGVVKRLLKRQDINLIIIATDAGREGELVARWILEKAHVSKPIKRLWVSSVTDKAITEGFNNLKSGEDYINLYNSAAARAEADWLVGINATRALTTKFNAQLSCGRVQTPTLAIINAVEEEIRSFIPQKYYCINAQSNGITFTWHDKKTNGTRIFSKEKCDQIIDGLSGKKLKIIEISKKRKYLSPPKLFDLTDLQRDANKAYNFSAKETQNIMQQLYESHKILTYPRTDSKYITSDIVPTIPERLRTIQGEYGKIAFKIARSPIAASSNFVDNKKVTDHHAIIPTEQAVFLDKLTDRERKIYNMVIKRFLSVLMPPCEYEEMTIKADVNGESFLARGKRIIAQGFKEIYTDSSEDDEQKDVKDQTLPDIKQGEYTVSHIKKTENLTKPPKPLNEATLLSAMENPSKFVQIASGSLAGTLTETGGLGTVATRADIIEKLFDSFCIEKRGSDIWLTQKGKQILDLAPEELRKPELTAKWEQELIKISKGQQTKQRFINEIVNYTKVIIAEIKASEKQYKHENITNQKCLACNKNMLAVNGKKGKMLICSDRECGFKKVVSLITNARCPTCHKKMELVGEGDSKRFICGCGFKEKLSVWEEKRGQGKGVSKKEVETFLKKQQKDEKVVNASIAEALKGLKFD